MLTDPPKSMARHAVLQVWALWSATAGAYGFGSRGAQGVSRGSRLGPLRSTSLAVEPSVGARSVSVASTPGELREAASLCGDSFPASSAAQHYGVLTDPGSLANVFFDARAPASVAVLRDGLLCLSRLASVMPNRVRPQVMPLRK